MNATAKTEDLKARVVALRKVRDDLFKEETPAANVVELRDRAVKLKRRIGRGGDTAEATKELAAIKAASAEATSVRDERRRAVKLELRVLERELARREREAVKAELATLDDEALQALIDEHVVLARGALKRAKAARSVLDDRVAAQRIRDLAASLSDAEKAALVEQLKKGAS